MSTRVYPVHLVQSAGEAVQGAFSTNEEDDDDVCRLTFRFPHGEHSAEADDYFDAMCVIRRSLELAGWRLLCYGGSRNVFPSRMSRDMGCRGQAAYKLELGRPARRAELVGIFDHGPDVEPASVDEQAAFYELWLRSLKRDQ